MSVNNTNHNKRNIIISLSIIFLIVATVTIVLILSNWWKESYLKSRTTNNITCNLKNNSKTAKIDNTKLGRKRDVELLNAEVLKQIIDADEKRLATEKEIFRSITSYDLKFVTNCQAEVQYQASATAQNTFKNYYELKSNENIANQFNVLKSKFAGQQLHPNWNYPNGEIKPLYVDIDWDYVLNLFSLYNGISTSKEDLQKQLLSFFQVLNEIVGENSVKKLIFTLQNPGKYWGEDSTTVAITTSYLNLELAYMIFFDGADIESEYKEGYWVSEAASTAIVHEYFHAIDFFLRASPNKERARYNQFDQFQGDDLKNVKSILKFNDINKAGRNILDAWNQKYNDSQEHLNPNNLKLELDFWDFEPSIELINYFADQFGVNNYQQKYLLAWSLIKSKYGRLGGREELFAEAGVTWILTPPERRDKTWELLNDFFLKYLPAKAKVKK